MITSLRLKDFKNFADETLRVGPFTVIVGANSSGKSNIRDAFRFLHGIGRGYTLAEIIGGKYGAGGQLESVPIRGATNEIIRIGKSASVPPPPLPAFAFDIALTTKADSAAYAIEVSRQIGMSGFRITYERLQMAAKPSMRSLGANTKTVRSIWGRTRLSTSISTDLLWCRSSRA